MYERLDQQLCGDAVLGIMLILLSEKLSETYGGTSISAATRRPITSRKVRCMQTFVVPIHGEAMVWYKSRDVISASAEDHLGSRLQHIFVDCLVDTDYANLDDTINLCITTPVSPSGMAFNTP
jgi:hypothetical protein